VQGNLIALRKIINESQGSGKLIDFTLIQGGSHKSSVTIDDLEFDNKNWGPLLLAILNNNLHIVKFYLEEIMLNPLIFLVKPNTNEEN
jgi:hypothetical protein